MTEIDTPLIFPRDATATYYTKLTAVPGARGLGQVSADVHVLHSLVMKAYEEHASPPSTTTATKQGNHRARLGILFCATRNETTGPETRPQAGTVNGLLVQSLARPNWDKVVADGLFVHERTTVTFHSYSAGDQVSVCMWANPVKEIASPQTARGRYTVGSSKVNLNNPNDLAAWMRRRMTAGGLQLDDRTLDVSAQGRGLRAPSKDGQLRIVLRAFRCRGTVVDPDLFTEMVMTGVGRGKSYGAGLLIVQKLQR